MIGIYFAAFIISILMVILLVCIGKRQNLTYFLLVFVTVAISNGGYFGLATSSNVEEAVLATQITYFGGLDIPPEARIMALADVFDALVSKRCYKEKMGYDEAFGIIEDSLGTHFDPVLGRLFINCRKELEGFYNQALKEEDSEEK